MLFFKKIKIKYRLWRIKKIDADIARLESNCNSIYSDICRILSDNKAEIRKKSIRLWQAEHRTRMNANNRAYYYRRKWQKLSER